MRTINEQTGWKRVYPKMICQEQDILRLITDYCYDIYNDEFMSYFRARTGIQVFSEVDDELLIPIKREDDLPHVDIIRGKLQDCWELYCQENELPEESEVQEDKPEIIDLFGND